MTELLTRDDALRLLGEVVAEAGEDFVYEPHDGVGEVCTYTTPDGDASCGVGRVIAKVSKEHMDYLHEYEWTHLGDDSDLGEFEPWAETVAAWGLPCVFEDAGLSHLFTGEAYRVLAAFQHQQDHQTPYGEALLFSRVLEEPVV